MIVFIMLMAIDNGDFKKNHSIVDNILKLLNIMKYISLITRLSNALSNTFM